MSHELLGESFDIHGGGLDLQFPHHENEIAQSACAHPHGEFARYWLHNEMVQVDGRKMSKSLGNFFTVRDLLDQGIPGEVIRFVLLSTHYRKPMDWTEEKRQEAEHKLGRWLAMTDGVTADSEVPDYLIDPLLDDLNTSLFFTRLNEFADAGALGALRAGLEFLGFASAYGADWSRKSLFSWSTYGGHHNELRPFLKRWEELRSKRDFAAADAYKAKLEATGLKLSITPFGPEAELLDHFDPEKLELLR